MVDIDLEAGALHALPDIGHRGREARRLRMTRAAVHVGDALKRPLVLTMLRTETALSSFAEPPWWP
jgi:hypothetical protein